MYGAYEQHEPSEEETAREQDLNDGVDENDELDEQCGGGPRCFDCGAWDKTTGHQDCPFPQNHE